MLSVYTQYFQLTQVLAFFLVARMLIHTQEALQSVCH